MAAPLTPASAPAEPSLSVTSGHLRPSPSDPSEPPAPGTSPHSPARGSAARPRLSHPPSVHLTQASPSLWAPLPLAVSPIQTTEGRARLVHFHGSHMDPSPVLGRGNEAPPQGTFWARCGPGVRRNRGALVKTTENAQTGTAACPPAGPSGGGQVTTWEASRGHSAAGGAFCLTLGPDSGLSLPALISAAPPATPPTFLGHFHFLCILKRSVNSHHSGH